MFRIPIIALLAFLSMGLSPAPAAQYRTIQLPLARHRTAASEFHHGKTILFPDGLVITLSSYRPIIGLTQFPDGPPLRPRRGYTFVATAWIVRNATKRTVTVAAWVAKSRGLWSSGFSTGNAAQFTLLAPGVTNQYFWLFEVATVGRVAIFYGPFPAHWLPSRG